MHTGSLTGILSIVFACRCFCAALGKQAVRSTEMDLQVAGLQASVVRMADSLTIPLASIPASLRFAVDTNLRSAQAHLSIVHSSHKRSQYRHAQRKQGGHSTHRQAALPRKAHTSAWQPHLPAPNSAFDDADQKPDEDDMQEDGTATGSDKPSFSRVSRPSPKQNEPGASLRLTSRLHAWPHVHTAQLNLHRMALCHRVMFSGSLTATGEPGGLGQTLSVLF